MARLKRGSAALETARRRLAGLKSITPAPDFGPSLKLDDYEQEINELSNALEDYNQKLSALDQMLNALNALEKQLNNKSKRFLAATGAQFGTNSTQYEQVGGTRDEERQRASRKGSSES